MQAVGQHTPGVNEPAQSDAEEPSAAAATPREVIEKLQAAKVRRRQARIGQSTHARQLRRGMCL